MAINTLINKSVSNFEKSAPMIFQSNDVNHLDSITTLLSYSPPVTDGVNYQNFETKQWRTRPSSSEFALDLTQTSTTSNKVILQGQLETTATTETWFKINLTTKGTLYLQDLSKDSDMVEAAIFNSVDDGSSYYDSIFDPTKQLNRYDVLPAGDYFVRISKNTDLKNDARLNQKLDFNVLINTETTADFSLPALQFDTAKSKIHVDLLPNQKDVFYKFTLNKATQFTLDTTKFKSQFDIGLYQSDTNGELKIGYSYLLNAPAKQTYNLAAGNYSLSVDAINVSNQTQTLDIPVSSKSPLNFYTTNNSTAPNILKADALHPKQALSLDANGNLELTYSFAANKIPNAAEDAQPNPTLFSDVQKNATRLALQAYEHIAKLKFQEISSDSTETANISFVNVTDLGEAAGDTVVSTSSSSDIKTALVRIDMSYHGNLNVNVGAEGYTILLHEIGHALGLKHPGQYANGGTSDAPYLTDTKDNQQYSLMSYNTHPYKQEDGTLFYSNTGAVSEKTPLLYDVGAIQTLYGANPNYNSGNTLYRWQTNSDPYMTIWDGGGIDTINVSNQNQPQKIDLRAGQFSSVGAVKIVYDDNSTAFYPAKDNVSIAYGTVIENVIGGSGDDTIIGNSVSNRLTGNGSNDNFVFVSPLGSFNVDTITDFSSSDRLTLDRSIFGALNPSDHLNASELLVGRNVLNATNSMQHIIFNTLNHGLYYDSDGVGGNKAVEFAILANITSLNADQIFIQG